MTYVLTRNTSMGCLRFAEAEGALVCAAFESDPAPQGEDRATPLLAEAARQVEEYLAGARTSFDLPLAPQGTPFMRAVWQELTLIPYGQTRTYGEIAARLGRPKAARAVGAACARNPIPFIVPCHRAVGADGSLTGFRGGLDMKRRLLALEGAL